MSGKDPERIQLLSLDEIKKILPQRKPELSEKWKVRSLGIFGSYAQGEARKSSDLDLLVEIDDPKIGLLRFIAFVNYPSYLLGVKVNIVEKEILKPGLGRHVTEKLESI